MCIDLSPTVLSLQQAIPNGCSANLDCAQSTEPSPQVSCNHWLAASCSEKACFAASCTNLFRAAALRRFRPPPCAIQVKASLKTSDYGALLLSRQTRDASGR